MHVFLFEACGLAHFEREIAEVDRALQVTCGPRPGAPLVGSGSLFVLVKGFLLILGRLPSVDRPAIATVVPNVAGEFLLLDAGANVECKPHQLVQFAVMGSLYAESVMRVKRPKVGLMSVGAEESKGGPRVREQ